MSVCIHDSNVYVEDQKHCKLETKYRKSFSGLRKMYDDDDDDDDDDNDDDEQNI